MTAANPPLGSSVWAKVWLVCGREECEDPNVERRLVLRLTPVDLADMSAWIRERRGTEKERKWRGRRAENLQERKGLNEG